jgi:glycerophosphoryl diester phosphodiesterase
MLKSLIWNSKKSLVVGHRGAEPENKIKGFSNGIRNGSQILECDVRLSKDKKAVIIHDVSIDRTTNSSGKVRNFTAQELSQLEIPSLKDLIVLLKKPENKNVCLAVEVKDVRNRTENTLLVSDVVKTISSHNFDSRCIILSFKRNLLIQSKLLNSNILTGFIYGPIYLNDPIQISDSCKSDVLWLHHSLINKDIVKRANEINKPVFAWTVNDDDSIQRMTDMGITGIVSDYPEKISNHLCRV